MAYSANVTVHSQLLSGTSVGSLRPVMSSNPSQGVRQPQQSEPASGFSAMSYAQSFSSLTKVSLDEMVSLRGALSSTFERSSSALPTENAALVLSTEKSSSLSSLGTGSDSKATSAFARSVVSGSAASTVLSPGSTARSRTAVSTRHRPTKTIETEVSTRGSITVTQLVTLPMPTHIRSTLAANNTSPAVVNGDRYVTFAVCIAVPVTLFVVLALAILIGLWLRRRSQQRSTDSEEDAAIKPHTFTRKKSWAAHNMF